MRVLPSIASESPFKICTPKQWMLNPSYFSNKRFYLFFPNEDQDSTFLLHMFLESVTFRDDQDYKLELVPIDKSNLYTFTSFPKERLKEVEEVAKLFKQILVPFEQEFVLEDEEEALKIHFPTLQNLWIATGEKLQADTVLNSIIGTMT
jgi:hypothetical protein